MANNENRKREFYVYQVVREEENKVEKKDDEKYIISPRSGRQPIKKIPDGMGYHKDTSSYDFVRPTHGLAKEVYDELRKELNGDYLEDEYEETNVVTTHTDKVEANVDYSTVDSFENRLPKNVTDARGDYVIEEEYIAKVDDIIVEEAEEVVTKSDEVIIEEDIIEESKEVKKPTVKLPSPKVSVNPKYDELEEKRATNIKIPSAKVVKYIPPKIDMLTIGSGFGDDDKTEAERQKRIINQTLADANIKAEVVDYIFGPTVTQFMISVKPGVNVNIIKSCESNLAMYLEAERIRIQTPIPGKPFAGIEVPKREKYRHIVHLGDIISSKEFRETKYKIPVVVGKDNSGMSMICDIAEMPHCLVAGTTKSGKSVCLNTFIISLLYHFSPRDLRFVLMDPKRLEFGPYEGIPHLAMPVITDKDDFPGALSWVYEEMERRYKIFETYGVRDFDRLNKKLVEDKKAKLPYLIMICDEFGDWFSGATPEVEDQIQKIAAKARAAGIHVVLAAQRPSKDVIKGTIKANFDTRLAFRVSSFEDSKIILGNGGAEKLEGYGDVLIKYAGKIERRLQGAYVDSEEIYRIIDFLKENNKCDYLVTKEELAQSSTSRQLGQNTGRSDGMEDEKFEEVAYYIVRNQNSSANAIAQDFNMGYNRANSILVALEKLGVVSSVVRGKQREVLVNEVELEMILNEI